MNPVHRGHVAMLHQAAARLELEGYAVLGGWLSPSHDAYLQPKARHLNTIGLSAAFRLEAARLTLSEDSLVEVGHWEASQPGHWPDFPVVCAALQQELRSTLLPGADVTVFYVCGTDHADKCGLAYGMGRGLGVVVVPRAGQTTSKDDPASLVYIAEPALGDMADFSSTKVRDAISRRDIEYIGHAQSDHAAKLLLQPDRAQFQNYTEDYAKLGVTAPVAAAAEEPAAETEQR